MRANTQSIGRVLQVPAGLATSDSRCGVLADWRRGLAVGVAGLMLAGTASGQWSSDAGQNLAVADRSGGQVQPKVVATADGGCYVSWFDNNTGGYDVYLQRLDADGYEQWPHNGVLVADRGYSSTQDYGLAVDAGGNAVAAFRDDRSGASQITASLVAPDGTLLWGGSGVQVSVTPGGNSPRVAATSDGEYVVGWSLGSGIRYQRLDAGGAAQWAADGIVETPASGSYLLADLQPSDDGSVIALWVYFNARHLYTQKYDAGGSPLWDGNPATPGVMDPVVVFDGSAVQFGYFPRFLSDGAGGAVYGWYETGGARHAYVQRASASGAEMFPHNGVACSLRAGRYQLTPSVAFDAASGEIFLAWTETNTVQSQWGLYAQRFSAAGQRLWGDEAVEILPLSAQQNSFVQALAYGGGVIVAAFSSSDGTVLAARLDDKGDAVWSPSPFEACSVVSGKSRLWAARTPGGTTLLAWGDARNDESDIYAQNINPDGSLGIPPGCLGDLDGDGDTDFDDLVVLLGDYACSGGSCAGDVDGDGDTDFSDLVGLLGAYGCGG